MFKRGKLPARYTLKSVRYALALASVIDTLGDPPPSSNAYFLAAQKVVPDVYGNDQYGDCVPVDSAYGLIVRTANASSATVIPTKQQVLDLYTAVAGFNADDPSTDVGTNESDMCQYLKTTGFLNHKLDAWGTLDPRNINHLKWSIQLFGGCRIGVNFPNYSEQQFMDRTAFDVSAYGDQETGGHDVRLLHYHGDMFYCSTWGRWMQPTTRAWLDKYTDEAHPELAYDWIKDQGLSPSGFDLATLESKLREAAA